MLKGVLDANAAKCPRARQSDIQSELIKPNSSGLVVKLEFTPACQAGGRGFESRRDRQCSWVFHEHTVE